MSLYQISPISVNHVQANPSATLSSFTYGIDVSLGLCFHSLVLHFVFMPHRVTYSKCVGDTLRDMQKKTELNKLCLDCGYGRGMFLFTLACV